MAPELLTRGWPASHAQRRLWLLDRITPGVDDEVTKLVDQVVSTLKGQFGAELRS